MATNRNYGRLTDGAITYAPIPLPLGGRLVFNARPVDYAASGYLPIMDMPPATNAAPTGQHYEPSGWTEADGAIVREYHAVDNPPPAPRVFSKLRAIGVLKATGVWAQVKAWIEANGLMDEYLAAQDFKEDNAYFTQGLAALKTQLGLTDEQVEAMLAQCAAEEV